MSTQQSPAACHVLVAAFDSFTTTVLEVESADVLTVRSRSRSCSAEQGLTTLFLQVETSSLVDVISVEQVSAFCGEEMRSHDMIALSLG